MEASPAGAVVLIWFPFSDLSRSKLRPVTANADLFEDQAGLLSEAMRSEIVSEVVKLLRAGEVSSRGK